MALADGSTEYSLSPGQGGRGNAHAFESTLRMATANYTSDTAETGTIKMIRLPAGVVRVYPWLSRILTSQFAATSDLHIGYAAYTNSAGTAVAGDDNAFADNLDVGGGPINQVWPLPATGTSLYTEFDSQTGIDIEILIDTANIESADTIEMVCAYTVIS